MKSAQVKLSLDPQLAAARGWTNPVVPGDHPDPTIVRVGSRFWASATSGEWSPQFPLFWSDDLARWTPSGAIFAQQPAWAEGSFWAPELVHDEVSDRLLVWYVARKRGGPLCIAVATSDVPEGPYIDHGPIVCQDDGSIDPCFARDEHGAPYLIWKEDGNSQGRPTPIWAQALSDDLLSLTGEKTQLIVNDQPWEEGVVEGPYLLRHDGRFYMFYAGNTCCGRECRYSEGVARADRLLGPWEKYPGNPLIGANDHWRCPGHGTVVHGSAVGGAEADYLLYHAYPAGDTIYVGREAVLDEVAWPQTDHDGRTGWPSINAGSGTDAFGETPLIDFTDDFASMFLKPAWQWPVNTQPETTTGTAGLRLGIPLESPLSDRPVESALIGVPRPAGDGYSATVWLHIDPEMDPRLWSGLSVVGDPFNTVGLGARGDALILWERRGAHQAVMWRGEGLARGEAVGLRVEHGGPGDGLQFFYSHGADVWEKAGENYDPSELPAWDRGLRIGLMLEGPRGLAARFQKFEMKTSKRLAEECKSV